jgi:hypothetical protein
MAEAMSEDQLKYHLEEYKSLRAEIAFTSKLLYDSFMWTVIASGAIAAWLLTHQTEINRLTPWVGRAVMFVPLAVSAMAALGFYHLDALIICVGRYLQRLEEKVALPGFGWEHSQRSNESISIARRSRVTFGIGWTFLNLMNLGLAILV